MLGIGKVPDILTTREIEDMLLEGIANQEPGEEAWIITPYSTMDKLGTIRRGITEACKTGVQINFVVRDEPEQVKSAERGLKEARENGLKLSAYPRLHAKLYWFENMFGIVTSANLVDGSFEASTELGLIVPCGGLHEGLREWIKGEIEPKLRFLDGPGDRRTSQNVSASTNRRAKSLSTPEDGFCIRCGKTIPENLSKPYCFTHYKSWATYSNPEYVEKHCHCCGGAAKATMVKPRCYACFKKG